MDLQTGLLGLVIVVVLPVVVYLISVFGIKEKTYEEALAEQRQRQDGEWSSSATSTNKSSSKDSKRSKRFGGRKSKDKGHGGANEELHVEFKADPEIIPDDDDDEDDNAEVTAVHSWRSKKVAEPKSILMRKDKDKSPVTATVVGKNIQAATAPSAKKQQPKAANKESVASAAASKVHQSKGKTPPPSTEKKDKTPPSVSKKEKTPPSVDKKMPPSVDKKEKTPPSVDKKEKTPPSVDKKEKTPLSADNNKKMPPCVEKKEKTPPTVDKKEKTPPSVHKKEKTPPSADKKEKSPPSLEKKGKTPSPPPPPKKDANDKKVEGKSSKERELKQTSSQHAQKPATATIDAAPKSAKVAQSNERVVQPTVGQKAAKRAKYDDDALSAQRITTLLRAAVLSHTEIQSLIELLLNRQQSNAAADSEWLRPGQRTDPLSALRKQLVERDESLTEERARSQANVQKLRDVRVELQAEKSRSAQMERVLKEERQELQTQVQTLQTRQEAKAQESAVANKKLTEEINRTRQALLQSEAKCDAAIREKQDLSDAIRQLDASLASSSMDVDGLQTENLQLQNRIAEEQHGYEQHAADLNAKLFISNEERVSALSKLSALQSHLTSSEGELAALGQRLVEVQAVAAAHETAKQQLESLLTELRGQHVELERQVATLNLQMQDERTTCAALDKELSSLREENEMLASQLSQLSERQEAEGHEGSGGDSSTVSDKTNGHIEHAENGEQTKILLSEHETILHEKEKLVDQLSHQIQDLSGFVAASKDEISRLLDEVDVQKTKNNALREKNWKAMDALGLAEKSAADRIKMVEQTWTERLAETQKIEQTSTQDLLEKLFPAVRIDKTVVYTDWIQRFAQLALVNLEETKAEWTARHSGSLAETDELRSRLASAEEMHTCAEAEVQQFKTVLDETVGMLNRLQSSVEAEESQWRNKLDAKEVEVEKLRDERKDLMDKLEELNIAQQTVAEMGTKLQLLKQDLKEAAEVERPQLESERDQARVLVEQVNAQLTEVQGRVQVLSEERDSLLERVQGLEAACEELAQLKQTNRELNAEVVKLTGQLKVGVDALKAEQQLVLELRNKLESPESNGPATDQIQILDDNESCSRSNADIDSGLFSLNASASSCRSLLPNSTSSPGRGIRDDKSSKRSKAKNRQRSRSVPERVRLLGCFG